MPWKMSSLASAATSASQTGNLCKLGERVGGSPTIVPPEATKSRIFLNKAGLIVVPAGRTRTRYDMPSGKTKEPFLTRIRLSITSALM